MPWIVAVGRFTGGKPSKHQLDIIPHFLRFMDGGLTGWELHLREGVTPRSTSGSFAKRHTDCLPGFTPVCRGRTG